jgi:ureidoacrylate peracid hydrolase
MSNQPNGAAVLIIDMQNGFVHADGSIPRAGAPLPNVDRVITSSVALVEAAREAHLPIVFTQHVFDPDYFDVAPRIVAKGMFDPETETLVRNSWDAAILDELKPLETERTVEKNRYDAFLYTDLDQVLRKLGVGRLLVGGVVTNVCVESTVRSAEQRDFEVIVAEDCTAGALEYHDAALAAMAYIAADVMPWRDGMEVLIAS